MATKQREGESEPNGLWQEIASGIDHHSSSDEFYDAVDGDDDVFHECPDEVACLANHNINRNISSSGDQRVADAVVASVAVPASGRRKGRWRAGSFQSAGVPMDQENSPLPSDAAPPGILPPSSSFLAAGPGSGGPGGPVWSWAWAGGCGPGRGLGGGFGHGGFGNLFLSPG